MKHVIKQSNTIADIVEKPVATLYLALTYFNTFLFCFVFWGEKRERGGGGANMEVLVFQ